MKINIFGIIFSLLLTIMLIGCGDDNPTENNDLEGSAKVFYPGAVGSSFDYDTDTLNTQTGNSGNFATRQSVFESKTTIGNTEYIVQNNTTNGNLFTTSSEFLFRTSDAGVYIYVDTNTVFSIISDSLIGDIGVPLDDITFKADEEVNLFSYISVVDGQSWLPFRFGIDAASQIGINISITLLEIQANPEGIESISIPAATEAVDAYKIKYILTLRIPNDQLTSIEEQTFTGYAWFAENIGLVKLEANAVITNVLFGGELDLSDTTTVFNDELTSYSLL